MEAVETLLSTGIELYLKNEKKRQKVHFLNHTDEKEKDLIDTHRHLTHYRFEINQFLEKKEIQMKKRIHTKWTFEDLIHFDYLYIFYHKSICIYLFQKENQHYMLFEGLHKWSDLKEMNVRRWITDKRLIEKESFLQEGILFYIHDCYMTPIVKDSFWNIFEFIKHKHYKKEDQQKIPLIVEGYSLGGLYLQLWIQYMDEKKMLEEFKIDAYQIESWFQGNEEEFQEFQKKVKIKNIMKHGSYFHLFNSIFQKYRKIDSFMPRSNETKEILYSKTPLRIIEYGVVSHLL